MLKKEDRQARSYSKDRLQFVRKGSKSVDTLPYFGTTPLVDKFQAVHDTMERFALAKEEWNNVTKNMSAEEWRKLARDTTEREPKLRALIKELDKGLDLRLEKPPSKQNDKPKRKTVKQVEQTEDQDSSDDNNPLKSLTVVEKKQAPGKSNISKFAKENPEKVVIFRRAFNRKSGKPLFNRYNFKIKSFSNSTITFDNNRVIRKSDIAIKFKNVKSHSVTGSQNKKLAGSAFQKLPRTQTPHPPRRPGT